MIPEFVTKQLHKVAKNEGFTDYKFEMEDGSSQGENFQGVLMAVKILGAKVLNGATKQEELRLMCKYPTVNETRKQIFMSKLVFNRELSVYSKVLPHFVRFQQENGLNEIDSFSSLAKMYACEIDDENEIYVLIMEDLRAKKYEMWPRENMIGIEQELLIVRELGKLHAISFAMKDQRPNEFEQYKQLNGPFSEIFLHGKMNLYTKRTVEKSIVVLRNPKHKKLMENFHKTYVETVSELLVGESSEEYGVFAHGDSWINNFLFQYADDDDDKQQIKSVKLIDWQWSGCVPAAIDFLHHVFATTDGAFRKQHYETIMKTYHSSLSENIRKLGSDPDKLYTYENFQSQLRKFGTFALLIGPFMVLIKVAEAGDVLDIDEFCGLLDRGVGADIINLNGEHSLSEYSRLVNEIVTDLVDYGYINLE